MLTRSRVSKALDVGRLAKAVSSPGIDSRVWVSIGAVKKVFVDAAHGVFADVVLMPSGAETTARVASIYAGPGYGIYVPLEPDDEVLVLMPSGENDEGPVILPRMWSASDKPPGNAKTDQADLLIHAKDGASLRVVVGGAGNVVIEPRGSGFVQLGAEAAVEHALRGNSFQDRFNAFVDIFNGHTHLDSTGSPSGPPITDPVIPNPGFIPFPVPGTAGPPSLINPMFIGTPTSGTSSPGSDLSPNVRVK